MLSMQIYFLIKQAYFDDRSIFGDGVMESQDLGLQSTKNIGVTC